MKNQYDVEKIAIELAAQDSATTDSRDWPYVKDILYKDRLPLLWAKICERAMQLTSDPILLNWFRLERINGLRRQDGMWDIDYVMLLLNETEQEIKLPTDFVGGIT